MFHVQAFDDIMTFEYLKSENMINSRMKTAFEAKQKTFFLVSNVLSFRHTKQTSKNAADTTFKVAKYFEFVIGNKQ